MIGSKDGGTMSIQRMMLALVLLSHSTDLAAQTTGVVAEYSITSVAPSESVTHTFFVRLMVMPDSWLLQGTGYSPHWNIPRIYPYPVDPRFQCDRSGSILLDRQKTSGTIAHSDLARWVNMEQQGFDVLYFAHARFGVWRPERSDFWELPAEGTPIVDRYSVTYPLRADVQVRLVRQQPEAIQLEQRFSGKHERLWCSRKFALKEALKTEGIPKWLPVSGTLFCTNGQFVRFDGEYKRPEVAPADTPFTPEEVEQIVLLSPKGKGGRWVEVDWTPFEGLAIPKSITVSLGVEKGGMLLRQSRLLGIRQLSTDEFNRVSQEQRSQTFDDELAILIDQATKLAWGKDLRRASQETRSEIDRLRKQLQKVVESTDSNGHRVMALQHLLLLAIAAENVDSEVLRNAMETHLNDLRTSASLQSVLASAFDLQSAALEWKRQDLVPLIWRVCQDKVSEYPVDEQLMTLIGAIHGVDADDLHASLLLHAASKAGPEFSDPRKVRAALLRIDGLLHRHQFNSQPQRVLFSEAVMLPERFNDFLKKCVLADDSMLSAVSESLLKHRLKSAGSP